MFSNSVLVTQILFVSVAVTRFVLAKKAGLNDFNGLIALAVLGTYFLSVDSFAELIDNSRNNGGCGGGCGGGGGGGGCGGCG